MKPIIGVTPLFDYQKNSIWMVPGYMNGIAEAGGLPLILPLTDKICDLSELVEKCDGFLFTGGNDINPALYNAPKSPVFAELSAERDAMEKELFELCLEHEKPALGICRGIQLFNALLGGSLYQDLPTEHPSSINHQMRPPYHLPVHTVKLVPGTPLQKYIGKSSLKVNSYHHQAVKSLAPCLRLQAFAPDGITEALYLPAHKFLHAVQWHPEFMHKSDPDSQKIFKFFTDNL